MGSRLAEVLWRRRSQKGRLAVVMAGVVLCIVAVSSPPNEPREMPAAAGTKALDVDARDARSQNSERNVLTSAPPSTAPAATVSSSTTEPRDESPVTTLDPDGSTPVAATFSERVSHVVDGDTVVMVGGAKVRLIGIDTPERGQCGYGEARDALIWLVADRPVRLSSGARDDVDKYGRLLRYLDTADGDANLAMIRSGWARARYDSRDGYGRHDREDVYVAASEVSTHRCGGPTSVSPAPSKTPPPAPAATQGLLPSAGKSAPRFSTCKAAKAAGYGPFLRGSVEYEWYRDADGDGIVCE